MKITQKTYITIFTVLLIAMLADPAAAQLHWEDGGRLLANVSSSVTHHTVTEDGSGGFFLAWEKNTGSDIDLYIQHFDAAGTATWNPGGVVITTASGDQTSPAIASDGSGGVFVAWQDELSYDIYLQHFDTGGSPLAASGGIPVCTAAGEQSGAAMTADCSGGVILAWYDTRNGSATDLYAQKINAFNQVQWTADGVPVTTAAGIQYTHSILADGSGGAVIVWQDGRNGQDDDIYAQRIDASGNPVWTVNGMTVAAAGGDQMDPRSAESGGNFIFAWVDEGDIYAQ